MILLLGRFREVKGHTIAIEAFQKLKTEYNSIGLYLAGDGPLEESIRKKVEDLSLTSDIFFLGRVEDVKNLINQMTLMIVPSIVEPFGLVAIEGLAAKKLVIASKVGGLLEILEDKKTGALVEHSNPEALFTAIDYYLKNPQKRDELAQKGYNHYLKYFTSEVMAKNYLDLYEAL